MVRFSLLHKYNLFFTIILFLAFLTFNSHYTLSSFFLSFLGAISSAVILYIVLYIVLFAFSFVGKFGLYFVSFCFLFTNIAIATDFFIYRIYNFHINAMVLNILTSPKAMESIQLGNAVLFTAIASIFILLVAEIFLTKRLLNKEKAKLKITNNKMNKALIIPFFIIILSEKVSYGFASLYSKTEILNIFKVIPLYQPLTFNKLAAKYFGIKTDKKMKNHISLSSKLDYPKKPLISKEKLNKPNIFIIASDSVNYKFINKTLSPNLMILKKYSLVFDNHYSGGNSTRFGIFSLLYGLNSSYWFSFISSYKGTVLFDYLKKVGYDINIVSSTSTSWPEFIKTAYVNITDKVYDKFGGKETPSWKKDEKSTEKMLQIIENMDINRPQFAFLFLDAPHGYSFPPNFNKYKSDKEINYLTLKKDSDELKNALNRYKNSIFYNDMLLGKVIKKLKEKNLYKNSIIIYTSDHGQEFYEYGLFGHNSSFSKAQTQVPFFMKMPNAKHKIITKMTSHLDFVPTILSYIGVKNDISDYSNGYNLLDENFKRDNVFITNWNNNAIKTDKFTYVFSNLPNKMFNNESRRNSDYKKTDRSIDSTLLMKIMKQNSHFYK